MQTDKRSREHVATLRHGLFFRQGVDLTDLPARMPLSQAASLRITGNRPNGEFKGWLKQNEILCWIIEQGENEYARMHREILGRLDRQEIDAFEALRLTQDIDLKAVSSGYVLATRTENDLFAIKMRWL